MTRVVDETKRVRDRMRAGTIKSLGKAAAYIRGVAQRSLSANAKKPSKPGKPPRSPTGRLRNSIVFAVDRLETEAVVGPTRVGAGAIGHTHEFGGSEPPKATPKAKRPFNINPGGHGPLRTGGSYRGRDREGRFIRKGEKGATRSRVVGVGRLDSPAQVRRAREIAEQLELPPSVTGAPTRNRRDYPARPFMARALRLALKRIPQFWKNSLRS